jgi:uncharacterized membrane protein YeaQ/YmgE (transglycosylase-associated protein family)
MVITGWVLFGFTVGLLANAAWPTWSGRGLIVMASAGIAGAVLFGALFRGIGDRPLLDVNGLVAAALGSVLFVAVGVLARRGRRQRIAGAGLRIA